MPAIELVDAKQPATFFIEYHNFGSVVVPDFTGEQVRSYLHLENIGSQVSYLSRAFVHHDVDGSYFKYDPTFLIEILSSHFTLAANLQRQRIYFKVPANFRRTPLRDGIQMPASAPSQSTLG